MNFIINVLQFLKKVRAKEVNQFWREEENSNDLESLLKRMRKR